MRAARAVACWCLAAALGAGHALAEDEKSREVTGHVGFLFRDVDLDGSRAKYDEDFDGLDTGLRLEELLLEWISDEGGLADHARLEASGLGGDPDEHVSFEVSRQDRFELELEHWRRRYVYDLFELVPDEDGHAWNARSERTGIDLTLHAASWADVILAFQEHRRSGDRTFMKDLSRDIFLLDAPVDRETRVYTAGADFRFGDVRVDFRQALRTYDRRFVNTADGDAGIDTGNATELDDYDWVERDESEAHLTTVRVRAPLGDRVHVNAGYHGTLFGTEDFRSRVRQDAEGVDFTGGALAIAGGFSQADIDRDHDLFDAEVAVRVAKDVTFRLGWRSLDLVDEGVLVQDLSATGTKTTRNVRIDLDVDTLTALLEYRPVRRLGVRVGYRLADRELQRDGYDGERDEDFRSDDDSSLVIGVSWRPVDWFRVNVDHEESDLDADFSSLSPLDRSRTRARLTFTPNDGIDFGVTWRAFEDENPTVPSRSEGDDWSLFVEHAPTEHVRWGLSWSRHEVERSAAVIFDGAAFGGPGATFPGETRYDVEQDHLAGHVDLSFEKGWRAFLRFDRVRADGRELAAGDDPNNPPAVPSELLLDQDRDDWEIGVEKELSSGIYFGGAIRWLDHDEANDKLDYDAEIVTFRLGYRY